AAQCDTLPRAARGDGGVVRQRLVAVQHDGGRRRRSTPDGGPTSAHHAAPAGAGAGRDGTLDGPACYTLIASDSPPRLQCGTIVALQCRLTSRNDEYTRIHSTCEK